MRDKRILVFGYGKLGARVAQALSAHNDVWVVSRSLQRAYSGIHFISADVCSPETLAELPTNIDCLLFCLSASEPSESAYQAVYVDGLRNILDVIKRATSRLPYCFFVSSTSVYHQDDASWVNEQSETMPVGFSGRCMLAAEQVLNASPFAGTSVRFSGIYGGARGRLIDQVVEGRANQSAGLRLTNRIHEDDCVGFLLHLFGLVSKGVSIAECYIGSDDCPVDLNEVIRFIAQEYGAAEPNIGPSDTRRAGNKRCDNSLMRQSGYVLQYPSYQEGYRKRSS